MTAAPGGESTARQAISTSKLMPVNVPYRRQQLPHYCGAACLQMVIGALRPNSSDPQSQLYADANSHSVLDPNSPWKSSPDGIEWVLGHRAGLQASTVSVLAVPLEDAVTRQIIWSLFTHQVAPIVLVYGWAHWVVVVGYEVSRNPTGPNDAAYDIEAVHIHNPWRSVAEGDAPPPPPPKHVAFSYWKSKYLKQVPSGFWDGMRVAVGVFP